MAKLVAGVRQLDRSPLFYTSNGYKFATATQANNHQRELNRVAKMRSIVSDVCGAVPSNRYIVNVSDVINAIRDPNKLAALLKVANV
jgi:hypothetical protein